MHETPSDRDDSELLRRIEIRRHGHHWVFEYRDADRRDLACFIAQLARERDTGIDWALASVLCTRILHMRRNDAGSTDPTVQAPIDLLPESFDQASSDLTR